MQGGLSAAKREMLIAIRTEEDEVWEDLEFNDGEVRTLHLLTIVSLLTCTLSKI